MPKFEQISKNIQQATIDNPSVSRKLTWININNAGKNEIDYLRKKYSFNIKHLQFSSAKTISPRSIVQKDDGYAFLILHFPFKKNDHIASTEIDFFIKKDLLTTVHNNEFSAINSFFNIFKKDGDSLLSYKSESAAILLYELLEKAMEACYALLDKNSIELDEVEEMIFSQKQKKAVSKILNLRRNIINFRKTVQNHKNILEKLEEEEGDLAPKKELKQRYGQLIDHTRKIWEALDNQKEMIEILNDTNESLMNYRLNDIMKTLTIFSVIVFPLTLLAAIFGMNTMGGMPFASHNNGFWIIILLMLAGSLSMILFFRKKKWL